MPKNKRVIIWSAIIIMLAVVLIIASNNENKAAEIYSDGYQKIELFTNGKFSANLYHDVKYTGSFSKNENSITFTANGKTFEAPIANDVLVLPTEWRDSHGHSTALKKQ